MSTVHRNVCLQAKFCKFRFEHVFLVNRVFSGFCFRVIFSNAALVRLVDLLWMCSTHKKWLRRSTKTKRNLFSVIVFGQLMHVCQIARPGLVDAVGLSFQSNEIVFTRAELCVCITE